jgi:hypothetical protein
VKVEARTTKARSQPGLWLRRLRMVVLVLLGLLLSDSGSTILRNEKRSCVRKCVALRALFTLAKLLHCALLFVTGRKGRFFQKMERAEIELLVEQEMNRRDELEEIRREQRAGVKPESKSRGVGVREFDSIRSGRRFESNPDLGRFERLGDTTRVNWSNESGPGPDFARDTFGRAHYPEGESSRVVEIEAGTRLGTSEETINLLPKAVTTIVSTATTTVATFIIKTAADTTKATDQRDGGPYNNGNYSNYQGRRGRYGNDGGATMAAGARLFPSEWRR